VKDATSFQFDFQKAKSPHCKRTVLILDSLAGRLQEFVTGLRVDDAFYFYYKFSGPDLYEQTSNLQNFAEYICHRYQIDYSDMMVIAKAEAATVVAAWVRDYAWPVAGLMFAGPEFPPGVDLNPRDLVTPILLISTGAVGDEKTLRETQFFKGLSSERREHYIYPTMKKDVFFDSFGEEMFARARELFYQVFQKKQFPETVKCIPVPRMPANKTTELLQAIKTDFLRDFGQISEGLRRGFQYGFHSFEYVDHIEVGKPQGQFLLGKVCDWLLLNSKKNKALEAKKKMIVATLKTLVHYFSLRKTPIRILALSAYSARSILEVVTQYPDLKIQTSICDHRSSALLQIANSAQAMNVRNIECLNLHDAFAFPNFTHSKPNLIVLSGFQPEDLALLSTQLSKLAFGDDAFFIYENDLIKNAQIEIDQIIRGLGFEKTNAQVEPGRNFTISVAQRRYLSEIFLDQKLDGKFFPRP